MHGLCGMLISKMGVAHWSAQANLFADVLPTRLNSFANWALGSERSDQSPSCHSERSEAESKNLSSCSAWRLRSRYRDASTSLSMTLLIGCLAGDVAETTVSDQTAFSEVAEIPARGALYKVDGELEQTNFPRIVYALYDRAERFVFVFNLPPGAIDNRVD
jgi:hypothetical protein